MFKKRGPAPATAPANKLTTQPSSPGLADNTSVPPKPKMYGPLATIGITLLLYFGAQIAAGLVIYAIPTLNHWTEARRTLWLEKPWVTFSYIFMAEAIALSVLYKIMQVRKVTFRKLGLNKFKSEYIGYALGAYAVYFMVYIVSLAAAKALIPGLNLDQKQELGFNNVTGLANLLPVFISLVILPPITEEIVVRGFLFGGLRTKLPFVGAAVITSALFALAHIGEGGSGGLLWVAVIDTFILSIVLCYLREKTGSLWAGIGVHMLKNAIAFIVLYNIFSYIR